MILARCALIVVYTWQHSWCRPWQTSGRGEASLALASTQNSAVPPPFHLLLFNLTSEKKHLTGLESPHCPPWTRWAQGRPPMKSSLGRQWGFGLGEGGAAQLCEDMSREAEGGREEIGPRKAWSLLNCRIYPAWHGMGWHMRTWHWFVSNCSLTKCHLQLVI